MSGLSCERVTRIFDRHGRGVRDVSLHVPAGSAVALFGPNGSGKTTLIHLCIGNLAPDHGHVTISGYDVQRHAAEARLRIAYVPELPRLYAHLSATGHLRFFDRLCGARRSEQRYAALLASLGLDAVVAQEPVRTYSKGMRQRVTIALGLLKGADMFILDEPTSGLDLPGRADLICALERLKSAGKAVLFSSHDLVTINQVADRVVCLRDGRIRTERATPISGDILES